jgi:hypothetical protein
VPTDDFKFRVAYSSKEIGTDSPFIGQEEFIKLNSWTYPIIEELPIDFESTYKTG